MNASERLPLLDYLTRNYDTLKRRVMQLTGNAELAEDAMQDTWVRMHVKADTRDESTFASPAGYLLRTALNIAIDIQRRQSRWLSTEEIEALDFLADPAPGPEQVVAARAEFDSMLDSLKSLSARRREVFVLAHWENMSKPEIAKRLGVSLRTVEYDFKYIHDKLNARFTR